MFFVFGTGEKERPLGSIEFDCPGCGRVRADVIKFERHFHAFFISLARWGARYFVAADCGCRFELNPVKGKAMERDPRVPLEPADLRRLDGFGPRCPRCGAELQKGFRFCPSCGRPL